MLKSPERRGFDAKFAALFSIDPDSVIAESDRHAKSIKDVGIGGVIRFDRKVYVVQKTATYTETKEDYSAKKKPYVATELVLFCLATGETHYIEWAEDDGLNISFVERKLTKDEMNRRLHDDEGKPFEIDEDIDEACENKWGIMFDRRLYGFDDWWPARFDSSDGRSYKAYLYEFGSDEIGWLTIEGWKDGKGWDYEGYLSQTVSEREVEIISLGN